MAYDQRVFRAHTHRYNLVDSDTREMVCACAAIEGEKPRRNKFNAITTQYKGKTFDSGLEANYAAELDLLIRSGNVKSYQTQVIMHLTAHREWICDYKLDFLVEWTDGTIEAVETKGLWTPDARIKWKLFVAQMGKEHPHMKLSVECEAKKAWRRGKKAP
jgi:hypothetical protein